MIYHAVEGPLGLRMSFPYSSQSIDRSTRTSLARLTNIDGATTRRCAPQRNRTTANIKRFVHFPGITSESRSLFKLS